MRRWDVLVVSATLAVLYLAASWQARSDEAQDFLTSLEAAVKAVAESATENYDNSCGLRDTCQSEQNCSMRQCFPLDGQQFQCAYIYNFTRCNATPNSKCNRILADFSRSMIRLPSNGSVTLPDAEVGTVASFFGPTICTHRPLDATFQTAARRFSYSNKTIYYSLYFGAADGVFRFYPGRETLNDNCNDYDPRIRPWYIGAISVKKNVVLLLDTGWAMVEDGPFIPPVSPMDTVKNLIRKLGQTLSLEDTITFISVNSSGSFLLNGPYPVSKNASETDESLEQFLNNPALDGPDFNEGKPSNFSAGFELANAASPPHNTTGDALKIILLFTDSNYGNKPPTDFVNSTLAPLKKEGVGIFVFDLASRNDSSPWNTARCRISLQSGQQLLLTAQQNPLLFLNPYFSFLARARIGANNGPTVFYAKPFQSATDLGTTLGVSYLAMSRDNATLVGVAALSVQTGGLPPDMVTALDKLLETDPYRRYRSTPRMSSFVDPITTCSVEYVKSCPDSQTDSLRPLCYSSTQPASDEKPQSLQCCSGDGCSTGRREGLDLWIILLIASTATALGLFSLGGCVYIIIRIKAPPRPGSSPQAISWEELPWEELNLATNGFHDDNIIGRGAFGVVYRGHLQEKKVAVKRLKRMPDHTDSFQAELRVNMKVSKHPNLVELKGACFRDQNSYLVYELVENGDLYRWLWPERDEMRAREQSGTVLFLSWNRRKEIAQGIAKGLDYLHRGLLPDGQIFHLDLKPRNILLDKYLTAKIADFGISQLYEPGHTIDIATVKEGSIGYMAPEILQGCILPNTKLDVYSFGVVLMQLVSGRKIDDQSLRPSFLQWARNLADRQDMNPDMIIDKHLLESVQPEFENSLLQNCREMIDIAMDCTEKAPERRPEMVQVLEVLANFQEVQELELPT